MVFLREWEVLFNNKNIIPLTTLSSMTSHSIGISKITGVAVSILALAAGGFSVYWFAYKKKSFKDLANVFAKFFAQFKK